MRRTVIGMAIGALASLAQAESSITLYGVADANIEYANNLSRVTPTAANGFATGAAGDRFAVASGGLSGSRWGLRGTEDLGAGLKALLVLESGFSIDTGSSQQSGRLFGRQAYVGLQYGNGQFTFGRQYTSAFDAFANFAPARYATQYDPAVALLGLNYRSDNTAKYIGTFGGLIAQAHWSFGNGVAGAGEVPGQFRRDTGYGGALTYGSGTLGLTLTYDQYNPTLTSAGATGLFRKIGGAASYTLGPAKLIAGYRWGRNTGANGNALLRDNFYWVGTNYQATSALGLWLAYYYLDVKNLAGVDIKNPWQITAIANYALSKRTDIYVTSAYSRNSGLNFDTSAISFANGYFLASGKNTMLGAAIGIRHRF